MRDGTTRGRDLSIFPLQVRSVPGAETLTEVRTSCGLFRESSNWVLHQRTSICFKRVMARELRSDVLTRLKYATSLACV